MKRTLAIVLLVALAGGVAVRAQEKKPVSPWAHLALEKAKAAHDGALLGLKAGTASVEDVARWSWNVCLADAEVNDDEASRRNALELHALHCRELEKLVADRRAAGAATNYDVDVAAYHRAQAERHLERLKGK